VTAAVDPGPDRPHLRVLHERPDADAGRAAAAASLFLAALGVLDDPVQRDATARRMTAAYTEMLTPRPFELTTFPNDEGYDELVLARSVPVRSVCEHHMLPFIGVAHVGYLPGDRIVGLSKLARVVEHFAHRPQVQERLTKQVADWLCTNLAPRGVGVVIEAEHLCMNLRGVRAERSSTTTSSLQGLLREDPRSRSEFLTLTSGRNAARPY
jgi:GTP cyclohydrolase I